MRFVSVLAGVAIFAASTGALASAPTCSSTTDWTSLGPPGLQGFSNFFDSAGSYTDCYAFTLSSAADSFGGTTERDGSFNQLDIDLQSVSLYVGDTLLGVDMSPEDFSFANLTGGQNVTYILAITSVVTSDRGLTDTDVGYRGHIAAVTAPVPEPSTYALMLAGLGALGFAARRRKG